MAKSNHPPELQVHSAVKWAKGGGWEGLLGVGEGDATAWAHSLFDVAWRRGRRLCSRLGFEYGFIYLIIIYMFLLFILFSVFMKYDGVSTKKMEYNSAQKSVY